MRALAVLLVWLAMLALHGQQARVATVRGEEVSGELTIRNGQLSLTDTNALKTNTIAVKNLQWLRVAHAPTDADSSRKARVVLINGTTLAGKVDRADSTAVYVGGPWPPVSTINVGRIILRDMTPELSERVPLERPGVLLRSKDFVDGDFKTLKDGRVRIESILFGNKSFSANDVAAIVLRQISPRPASWTIQLRGKSELFATNITFRGTNFIAEESLLGPIAIEAGRIETIRRQDKS